MTILLNDCKNIFRYTDSNVLAQWITSNLIYPDGSTFTSGGINQALNDVLGKRGDRSNVQNIVIVITDGIPTIPEPNSNARYAFFSNR